MVPRWPAACAALMMLVAAFSPCPVHADERTVTIPLSELGYRDGVTIAGGTPRFTLDVPHYASLRAAALQLELEVSQAADPDSTVTVSVNGVPAWTRPLVTIGNDAHVTIPLPLPPHQPRRRLFVTVSAALHGADTGCGAPQAGGLSMTVGPETALVVQAATGGSAAAFFRDYRGNVDLVGTSADAGIVAVPYRIGRLEPWHRIDVAQVAAPEPGRRTIVLADGARTERSGDVLRLSPQAFEALPALDASAQQRRPGSVSFADVGQRLTSQTGAGELTFDVPLAGSIVGGIPDHFHAHVVLAHSALPAPATATMQIVVNGTLVAARDLRRDAGTETLDTAVPRYIVGPSNDVRVIVASSTPDACRDGVPEMTASILGDSSFSWSGVDRFPPTVESFLTLLSGRVIVLVEPEFIHAATHFMGELGKLNAGIAQLDVQPYDGRVPPGYDYALIFTAPEKLRDLAVPVHGEAGFAIVNPVDGTDALRVAGDDRMGTLQVGRIGGTAFLAVSYHGDPSAVEAIDTVRASQLATQVASVSIIDANGATAYDVGEKLRVRYADDDVLGIAWGRARLGIAIGLLLLLLWGCRYVSRRLTGRTLG
jgi:hypothetical protein